MSWDEDDDVMKAVKVFVALLGAALVIVGVVGLADGAAVAGFVELVFGVVLIVAVVAPEVLDLDVNVSFRR